MNSALDTAGRVADSVLSAACRSSFVLPVALLVVVFERVGVPVAILFSTLTLFVFAEMTPKAIGAASPVAISSLSISLIDLRRCKKDRGGRTAGAADRRGGPPGGARRAGLRVEFVHGGLRPRARRLGKLALKALTLLHQRRDRMHHGRHSRLGVARATSV